MKTISIFGKGNMGKAIGGIFEGTGHSVTYFDSKSSVDQVGDIVVLAVPYPAVSEILSSYKDLLSDKIIIDITNPVNFDTFDDLTVPTDSSAAAEIAKKLPNAAVIKAFNTTFAATLTSKKVANSHQTTVLMASNNQTAKEQVMKELEGSGLAVIDVGSLKRARELEAIGFLQISLAGSEKISWNGGFGVFK